MQLIVHIRESLMSIDPVDNFVNSCTFMHYLHHVIMIILSLNRDSFGMRIHIKWWQSVCIVCQSLLINPLLRVIGCANPDNSEL